MSECMFTISRPTARKTRRAVLARLRGQAPGGVMSAECFMISRSPTEHENADLRHAGMDRRHPGPQDASGDIHVNLDSSTPCWNDAGEGFCLNRCGAPFSEIF